MTDASETQTQRGFLPTVDYNRDSPASVFTPRQIEYLESISSYISPADLENVRRIEWFMYNPNSDAYGDSLVPGLRGDIDIRGARKGFVYFKRFAPLSYTKLVDQFLDGVPEYFPKSGSGGSMPGYRVTTPNGDRFYPIEFFGDLDAWHKRLQESADLHGSELAQFDRGTFVISDGQRFSFGDLRVDLLEARRHPKTW